MADDFNDAEEYADDWLITIRVPDMPDVQLQKCVKLGRVRHTLNDIREQMPELVATASRVGRVLRSVERVSKDV